MKVILLILLEIGDMCLACIDNILHNLPDGSEMSGAHGHGYEVSPQFSSSLSHKISYTPITILSICGNN